jgi:LacI family transcriptional regulator
MAALLELETPPTAIFIANLNQALGALAAVRARGLDVPGSLSLVCHDDDPLFSFLDVPLTAVDMPLYELGEAAVDALLAQIAGSPAADVEIDSAPVIVDRGSTGRVLQ